MADEPYIIDDVDGERFRLNRSVLIDPVILEQESERIFARSWIYVGHESEIAEPGDFRTRTVAGRPLIFARDGAGCVRGYLNTCRHRGAMLCREREGNRRRFTCMYHGWATVVNRASSSISEPPHDNTDDGADDTEPLSRAPLPIPSLVQAPDGGSVSV